MKKILVCIMSAFMLFSNLTNIYAVGDENESTSFIVNGTNYEIFTEAFEAATEYDNGYYKLIYDITGTVTGDEGFTGYTVNENEEFVIDLNGHNIVIEDKISINKTFILFLNYGKTTIKDSSEENGMIKVYNNKTMDPSYANATVIIRSGKWAASEANQIVTEVNIDGGYLTAESEDAEGYANMIYVIDALDATTVNLKDGTLQSDYYPIRLYVQNGYGNVDLNMTGGLLKQGEGRRVPVVYAQYGGFGNNPNSSYCINIDISGGSIYCPNDSFIYYGIDDGKTIPLNISVENCNISSPGIIDDHYYLIIEDDEQWFKLIDIELGQNVIVDQDYIRNDLKWDELIDPRLGAIEINNESDVDVMLSTALKYGNTEYYYDDLYFVSSNSITITPADIDIYTGGNGYEGIVDTSGNVVSDHGFPEPGYYVTLPDGLNNLLTENEGVDLVDLSDKITFEYDDGTNSRSWKLRLYGPNENSTDVSVAGDTRPRYIYKLIPASDDQDPVLLQIKDEENIITSDKFEPDISEIYKEYDISVYGGDIVDLNKIVATITINNNEYEVPVTVESGKLTVKGVNESKTYEIAASEDEISADNISLVSSSDFYINGSNVKVEDTSGVRLLIDSPIIDLENLIDDNYLVSFDSDYEIDQAYIDVVDTNNGNADLSLDESATIYWPVQQDFATGGDFKILHFKNTNRDQESSVSELEEINGEVVTIDGKNYFKFETDSFSAFALIYETRSSTHIDHDPKPSKPSSPSSKPDKTYDKYDTNKDGVVSCEELLGKYWVWDEGKKACVYSLDSQGIIVNTATK